METFSAVLVPMLGGFNGHLWIPRTKVSDPELWCFFDLGLSQQMSNKWRRQWFKTPSRSLWRHCNDGRRRDDAMTYTWFSALLASCEGIESPHKRSTIRIFDVFFDVSLNMWRHCNTIPRNFGILRVLMNRDSRVLRNLKTGTNPKLIATLSTLSHATLPNPMYTYWTVFFNIGILS